MKRALTTRRPSARFPGLAIRVLAGVTSLGMALIVGQACSLSTSDETSGDEVEAGVIGSDAASAAADGSRGRSDGSASSPPALDGGVGAADLDAGDPPSSGGTITFQSIGATGWFPSRRDPDGGTCDAFQSATCCLAKETITSDALTPWDEDLILTLRGPMQVKQLVVYQPASGNSGNWDLVSAWDSRSASAPQGMSFDGNGTDKSGFAGTVGTECLVNVSTKDVFACGPGSDPYCPPPAAGKQATLGWSGSKLFVMLASMPHASDVGSPCSKDNTGNWYDAPWLGLSVGELVRAGSFVSCQCYAKDPNKGYLADGCGQFNVFEVVNDNNAYKNLDVFSTNMIGYAGYVGEGPCGPQCDVSKLAADVDLIEKATDTAAAAGAISNPTKGPGAAFRRPELGYRYFVILLDVASRSVQLAIVHPQRIPSAIAPLLPALPASFDAQTLTSLRDLRLPK